MFERKVDNKGALLNLDDRKDKLTKRYNSITADGVKIHNLINVK